MCYDANLGKIKQTITVVFEVIYMYLRLKRASSLRICHSSDFEFPNNLISSVISIMDEMF